ncbi:Amino acid transporter, transmembrane domain [Dillenia turbinata]|uniref:Amino acid transporter, transmembrane domain n=1 Tax=Dillenia turbinata TaxID=194707 RepID=A0AAN8UVU1_9MAGN
MGVVMVKDVIVFLEQRTGAKAFGNLSAPLYPVGVAVYCFEGIGMVLPLESETKDKTNYGKVVFLTMRFVYEIVERYFTGGRFCLWLRWLMVLLVSLVAISFPNFTDFLSLVRNSICCGLEFVLPSLFHLLVFKEMVGWKGVSSDIVIMILGIVLAVSGTWYSLMEMFSVKV